MRFRPLLVTTICLLPAAALAQAPPTRSGPEVVGVFLVSHLTDDESFLGLGLAAGGGIGYRWRGRVGVEGRVERFSHTRNFDSGVRFETDGTRALGQVFYYWSDGNAQPFVAGAFGVIKVDGTRRFPVVQPGPTGAPVQIGTEEFSGTLTDKFWGASGGVRVRVTDRFALRPEAGLLWSVPNNFIDIRFGVAASIGW